MSVTAAAGTAPTFDNCRFCWMCRHVCPVGHVTHRETLTPHAWALTIASVARGQLAWNAETAEVMYSCADCGLCRAHCVTDQPLPDAIVAAREAIVAADSAPPAVLEIDRRLLAFANPYVDVAPAAAAGRGPIGVFVGDAARHLRPPMMAAVRALLGAMDLEYVPIGVGRSTGLVANTLGLRETARSLAQAVLDEIRAAGVQDLFVLTPGDRWTFEYVYPRRLAMAWPEGVRIRDLTAALWEAVEAGRVRAARATSAGAWVYHEPCHTPRVGTGAAARALSSALLGDPAPRPLFWREQRSHPCGALGGLEFVQPRIAAALAEARLEDARAAGAAHIVTEDPACAGHLGSRSAGVEVVGLYELLASRLL